MERTTIIELEKIQAQTRFRRIQYLKKTLKTFFSLSILYFLYQTLSPLVSPHVLDVLNSPNREVIFLLCNAILIFLAKGSGVTEQCCQGLQANSVHGSSTRSMEVVVVHCGKEEKELVLDEVEKVQKEELVLYEEEKEEEGQIENICEFVENNILEEKYFLSEEQQQELLKGDREFEEYIRRTKCRMRLENLGIVAV